MWGGGDDYESFPTVRKKPVKYRNFLRNSVFFCDHREALIIIHGGGGVGFEIGGWKARISICVYVEGGGMFQYLGHCFNYDFSLSLFKV